MFVRRLINNMTFYEDVYPLKCSYEGLSTIRHFMKMFTLSWNVRTKAYQLITIWHFMKMFTPWNVRTKAYQQSWHFMKMFTPWNVRTKAYQQYDNMTRRLLWRCLPPEMFVRRLINPLKCSYYQQKDILWRCLPQQWNVRTKILSTIWHFMKMFTPWNVRTKAYQQYDILWRCLPPEMIVRRLINNMTFYEDVYPLKCCKGLCSYEGLSTIWHFMKMFTPWHVRTPIRHEMFVRRLINNKTFYEDVYPLKCSYEGLSTTFLWRCPPPPEIRVINNMTFYKDVYPLKRSYEGLSTIRHFMKMFTPWNVRTKAYQQYDILWRCFLWRCLPPEMFVRRLINNKTFYEDVCS